MAPKNVAVSVHFICSMALNREDRIPLQRAKVVRFIQSHTLFLLTALLKDPSVLLYNDGERRGFGTDV
jgi:hypothetical protein